MASNTDKSASTHKTGYTNSDATSQAAIACTTVLQAFEDRLAKQEMTLNRKRHDDLLSLRKVYKAIAQEQGTDLATVNSKRGRYLPAAYVQGTPDAPDEATPLEAAPRQSNTLDGGKGYLDLQAAVSHLVESVKTFEEAPFSAKKEGVTQQTAEEMAAYLIHTLLFQPSGIPGSVINGQVVQTAIDSVVAYYEAQHDALVAQQEVDAAAMYSEEPYPTEP